MEKTIEELKKIAEEAMLRATKEMIGRSVLDLLDSDGHVFSKRPCTTCQTVSKLIEQPFGCVKRAQPKPKADFLWPHEKHSLEEAGYEFVNAKTEAYRKQWWDILKERIEDNWKSR